MMFRNPREILNYMSNHNLPHIYLWVDCNPIGDGKRTRLRFERSGSDITSRLRENPGMSSGTDYKWCTCWTTEYTGVFTLDEEPKDERKTIFEDAGEVVKYMKARNIFRLYLWVDSNPRGEGKRTKLLFEIYNDSISSLLPENLLPEDPVGYQFNTYWAKYYEGTFTIAEGNIDYIGGTVWSAKYGKTLSPTEESVEREEAVDLRFRRPDVYEVGDLVQVMDIAREVGGFETWSKKAQDMVGNVYIITCVNDNFNGVYYNLENGEGEYRFPYYCVKKTTQVKEATAKWPNGSEKVAPVIGTRYWFIDNEHGVGEDAYAGYPLDNLRLGNKELFLTVESASQADTVKDRKAETMAEIGRIDKDWTADWEDSEQKKYYIYFDSGQVFCSGVAYTHCNEGTTYMSKEAANHILSDAYTDEDRMAFMGIVENKE